MSWVKSLETKKLPFEYPLREALKIYARTLMWSLIAIVLSCMLLVVMFVVVHWPKELLLIVGGVVLGFLHRELWLRFLLFVYKYPMGYTTVYSSPTFDLNLEELPPEVREKLSAVEDLLFDLPDAAEAVARVEAEHRIAELREHVEQEEAKLSARRAQLQEMREELSLLSVSVAAALEGQVYVLPLGTRGQARTLRLSPEQIAAIRFELRAEGDELKVYADFGSGEFQEVSLTLGGSVIPQSPTAHSGTIRTAEQQEQPGTEGSATIHPWQLTALETTVLQLLTWGSTVDEVAWTLAVSPQQVDDFIGNIRLKLGVESLDEAIGYAIRTGLVGPEEEVPTVVEALDEGAEAMPSLDPDEQHERPGTEGSAAVHQGRQLTEFELAVVGLIVKHHTSLRIARPLGELATLRAFRKLSSRLRGEGRKPQLTVRETEVLRLKMDGFSNSQIAQTLQMDVRTVRAHVRKIRSKLRATGREDAAIMARYLGLVEPRAESGAALGSVTAPEPRGKEGTEDAPSGAAVNQERGAEQA